MGTYIVSASIGSGNTTGKIFTQGSEGIKEIELTFQSVVGLGRPKLKRDITTGNVIKGECVYINKDGTAVPYTIGQKLQRDVVHGEQRLLNGSNVALLTSLLNKLGVPKGSGLILSLAIPTWNFYLKHGDDKVENTDLINDVKKTYKEMLIGYKIVDIKILPEAVPPLYSLMFTTTGMLRKEHYEVGNSILCIDIGAYTTDLSRVVIESGSPIATDMNFETSIPDYGVRGIDNFLNEYVCNSVKKSGIAIDSLNPIQIAEVYLNKQLTISGKTVDCKPLILQAMSAQAQRIYNGLMEAFKPEKYNTISVSGGGATVFKGYINKWFPNAVVRDHRATNDGLGVVAINMAKGKVKEAGYTGASKTVQGTIEALGEMYG